MRWVPARTTIIFMKTTTDITVPGELGRRFWATIPARVRTAEEIEALRELAALVEEEEREEREAVAKWLAG